MNPRNVLSKFTIQLNKYYTLDIAWVCSKPQQRITVPDFSQNFDFLYSQVVLYTEHNLTVILGAQETFVKSCREWFSRRLRDVPKHSI